MADRAPGQQRSRQGVSRMDAQLPIHIAEVVLNRPRPHHQSPPYFGIGQRLA
jgi:hypothetical protein